MKPMIEIQKATAEDAAVITSLMHEAFRQTVPPSSALLETVESVRRQMETGQEQAALATRQGRAVGMVRFQLQPEALYFFRLSVNPKEQGKGIGRALLTWLEQYAREQGKRAVACRVRMEIEKNVRLYLNAGFHITGQDIVERPNTPKIPTASMQKNLP